MDIKLCLDAMLASKHAAATQNPPPTLVEAPAEKEAILSRDHTKSGVRSLYGRPVTHAELRSALGAVRTCLEATSFGLSSNQVESDEVLLQKLFSGFDTYSTKLSTMYAHLDAELAARGVFPTDLRVVTMVAAGGCPFREFGMGDNEERAGENQLELALNYGFVVDFVPLTFADFHSNIVNMGVAIGAVLLAKAWARDAGRVRMDAVMFACKGTLAAALAARSYLLDVESGTEAKPLALLGLGTDLTQGFEDLTDAEITQCQQTLHLTVLNSLQDTNVGGEAAQADLTARVERVAGESGRAHFIDVEAQLDLFNGRNPEHSWYPSAFIRKSAAPVKGLILTQLALLCGAGTPEVDVDETAVAAEAEAAESSAAKSIQRALQKVRARKAPTPAVPLAEPHRVLAASTSPKTNAPAPIRGPMMQNPLLMGPLLMGIKMGKMSDLRPTQTNVTLLKDFVGNEMFVAE